MKSVLNAEFTRLKVSSFYSGQQNYTNRKPVKVDSIYLNVAKDTLVVHFGKSLAEMPIRNDDLPKIKSQIKKYLPQEFKNRALQILVNHTDLQELIPNYYREAQRKDKSRLTQQCSQVKRKNVVSPKRLYEIPSGLKNSNIALWHSHGWYYEAKLNRWEWQRARLFTSLEDISPMAFVIPFLAPMLENAGANLFIPRERDLQIHEVIVDNNGSMGKSKFKKPRKRKGKLSGFKTTRLVYENENPFQLGTSILFKGLRKGNRATYIPDIPEKGEYAVYVSYAKGEGIVIYRVFHAGGTTDFEVNQKMGYGTWIYLDKFHFAKGINKKIGRVELITPEGSNLLYSADAVRFGGGLGNIERNGKISGRARCFEAARYFLQYSGAPDTLVWKLNENSDYKDDYMSRGEWVNWLMGMPLCSSKNSQPYGLNIPIDMAFAFHTDAGVLPDDGIIGTLGIYSTDRDTNIFADGQSKYASRDLTDLIQTQIVDDINSIYKCNWTRRGMWNAQYSEAYRPQVPTMLLELLSHQNLNDVKYALHPKFRFDVSRAIYKGMLRFIATQNAYDYVVQPLPVNNLFAEFVGKRSVKLGWKAVIDSIEPTAIPEKYMVYTRIGNNGFNNGVLVDKPEIVISDLDKNKVYGFKVTAVNAGGESFPSEIISVGIAPNKKGEVLIINGFDRVDAPAVLETDSLSGVCRQLDHGVAYDYDISTTGNQYNFNKKAVWKDDDAPGHGASYADLETTIFRGNTFDFSYVHGKSILANGYSFVTASDEAVENSMVNLSYYHLLDLLYGEEKKTKLPGKDTANQYAIYTDKMIKALEAYTQTGGGIFISGAYIGTEIPTNKVAKKRVEELFRYQHRTNYAAKGGQFYSVANNFSLSGGFNTNYNLKQYPVEAPDGIEPYSKQSDTIFRYKENNVSAGTFYKAAYSVVALGFPFEAIKGKKQRDSLMKQVLQNLNKK